MAILWYFGGLVPWSDFPSVQWDQSSKRLEELTFLVLFQRSFLAAVILGSATVPSSSSLSVLNMRSLSQRLEDTWVAGTVQVPYLPQVALTWAALEAWLAG